MNYGDCFGCDKLGKAEDRWNEDLTGETAEELPKV